MPIRKIPKNYRNVTGINIGIKAQGFAAFESTLERDFITLLEFSSNVSHYEVQPVVVCWTDHLGKPRKYTPDTLVHFIDGSTMLYEVKYRTDIKLNWQELKPKFKAALQFCKTQNWRFKIITEKEIRTTYLSNAKFLLPYIHQAPQYHYYEQHQSILIQKLDELGHITPKQLLGYLSEDPWHQAQALPALWYLVGKGQIQTNLDEALTMDSVIWSNK